MEFINLTGRKAMVMVYDQGEPASMRELWKASLDGNRTVSFNQARINEKYKARVVVHYRDDFGNPEDKSLWIENITADQKIEIENIQGHNGFTLSVKPDLKKSNLKRSNSGDSQEQEYPLSFGIGKADITYEDTAKMARLAGWGVEQIAKGVEQRLYSRAYIIQDTKKVPVVIVIADLWACSLLVKRHVLLKLSNRKIKYTADNVLIAGTHTHSAPGGYTGWALYDRSCGGWNEKVFWTVVDGIVKSIIKAEDDLGEGKIYIKKEDLLFCGHNRSGDAYNNNENKDLKKYPGSNTDKEMLLLKFVRVLKDKDNKDTIVPWGALNWYAIHPTNRGQENTMINGDNKGYAAAKMEEHFGEIVKLAGKSGTATPPDGFVGAFANSNCGDVSGNSKTVRTTSEEVQNMIKYGNLQSDHAVKMFEGANTELKGLIEYRHHEKNMTTIGDLGNDEHGKPKRTYRGALGLSFFAGSTEDGKSPIGLKEGITETPGGVSFDERMKQLLLIKAFTTFTLADLIPVPDLLPWADNFLKLAVNIGAKSLTELEDFERLGHLPKPITLITGPAMHSDVKQLTPEILPVQLFRIGDLAVAGIPAELTTMAGRKLRESLFTNLPGVNYVALACYANDYSQYVTTFKEYEKQHYEGASVLFGPHTLDAYIKLFGELSREISALPKTRSVREFTANAELH